MMLQVKNCKGLCSFSVAVICLFAIAVSFAGCKDKEPESLIGNVDQPGWTKPADYDMTASMTAIVKVDLARSFPKQIKDAEQAVSADDILAAFVGENCVGTATPTQGLFFLYIAGPKSDGENTQVTLRYYSAILKNTFVATETIAFRNDGHLGSVSEPYTPEWVVAK